MNTYLPKLTLLLICLIFSYPQCSGEPQEDVRSYIQTLHKYDEEKTFFKNIEGFRIHLQQDVDGVLIQELLKDDKLRKYLLSNFDGAPDRFVDLILAYHLEDGPNWGSLGGFYRSPSGGISAALQNRLNPKQIKDNMVPGSLYFVLEYREVRLEISKVLRELYTDEILPMEVVEARKFNAWNKIIQIVNNSYESLFEENRLKREKYRLEAQQLAQSKTGKNLLQKKLFPEPEKRIPPEIAQQKPLEYKLSRWWYGVLFAFVFIGGLWFCFHKKTQN